MEIWILAGIALILIDMAFGCSTLILTIAGLACIFTYPLLGILFPEDQFYDIFLEFKTFFSLFIFLLIPSWSWVLLRKNKKNHEYTNMIGQIAYTTSILKNNELGSVKWSGTSCKAMIDPKSNHKSIEAGMQVIIIGIERNVLVIDINS